MMAIEGMMDRIGRKLGIDPADVRRRNVIKPEDMPWTSAVGVRYDTGSYLECIEKALVGSEYVAFRKQQTKDRLKDGKYRGIGICNMTEFTGMGALAWRSRGLARMSGVDSATLRVEPSGQIVVSVSHAAAGQGHLTTFAQVAADYLGADIADMRIMEGDTAVSPYGTNTFASRSAVTGGGAVIRAASKVAAKIRRMAAHLLSANEADIELRNGRAEVGGIAPRSMSFREIARVAYSQCDISLPPGEEYGLEASEYYDPPVVTIANAVHVVAVSVDAQDGRVTIDKHVIVHDCGRVINPMIVDGQIHGGAAQGVGEALMEEIVYDENGQLLNASLLDYLLPTAMDVPDFAVSHIETPTIDGLGGFKGVGEGGLIGTVPAVVNAVADALSGIGANVNRIPMRPSYLRDLLRQSAR
jgi:carbon-monoxide dehydrogenase large subunit